MPSGLVIPFFGSADGRAPQCGGARRIERGCGRSLSRASNDALLRERPDGLLGPASTCAPATGRAAGIGGRDRSRGPCFPRALGRCLFRRCCLFLEASLVVRIACENVPYDRCSRSVRDMGKRHQQQGPRSFWFDPAHRGTGSTPYPANSGSIIWNLLRNPVLGGNNPSTS